MYVSATTAELNRPRMGGQLRCSPTVSMSISAIGRPFWACSTRDRKSTRLNSSHSQISYAVLCLKKKQDLHPQVAKFGVLRPERLCLDGSARGAVLGIKVDHQRVAPVLGQADRRAVLVAPFDLGD